MNPTINPEDKNENTQNNMPQAPQFNTSPPPVPTPQPPQNTEPSVSAGLIILQWLTYAFWGWTLLCLSALVSIVVTNMINKVDVSDTIPYVIAAVLVLLPISAICDFFYSKHESQKKRGASMVVMIIHAVIFALFAIGALIGSVFSIVQLMLATDSTTNSTAGLISLLIIAVLYGLTFVRTLNPAQVGFSITKAFTPIMIFVAGLFIVLSFTGPIAQSFTSKDDRRIESHLDGVKLGVDDYISEEGKLPSQLSDISISDKDSQALVDDGLVEYKAVGKAGDDSYSTSYRYKLCVDYSAAKDDPYSGSREYDSEYSSYVSTYDHPEGEVCYKLETYSYNDDYSSDSSNGVDISSQDSTTVQD